MPIAAKWKTIAPRAKEQHNLTLEFAFPTHASPCPRKSRVRLVSVQHFPIRPSIKCGKKSLGTVFVFFRADYGVPMSPGVWLINLLVRLYRSTAPVSVRRCCRFEPSCSQYMLLAVSKHGSLTGLRLGLARIARCRPPNGGIDVP